MTEGQGVSVGINLSLKSITLWGMRMRAERQELVVFSLAARLFVIATALA